MHDDLLQIGFTLTDEDGNLAPGVHTFQFNMHYDTSKVMDYYFLIQMLATNKDEPLCKEREMFLKVMHAYFPNSYDVQCMIGDEERNFGATSLTKLAAFHKKRSETFETDYHGQIFGVGNTNKPEESPKYYFQESSQEVTSSPPLLVYSPVPYPPASPSPFSSEPPPRLLHLPGHRPFNYPSPWGLAQAMVQNISQPADQNLVYGIQDVWKGNLEQEFKVIRHLVAKYPYIAMDTEFPGIVARPIGEFRTQTEYQYQMVKVNVDQLKIIQIGFTFMDSEGNLPPGTSTWQFNFQFNLTDDSYATDSIDLLNKSGIQFARHKEEGIGMNAFAELLTTSGIVLNPDVKFISFHSGYDFGYLLKVLTNDLLPTTESEFFELVRIYFPKLYDVKYLMKSCKNLHGGLQDISDVLELKRVGPQHQAGSDARLTGQAFFTMRHMYFEDHIDDTKYCGQLYGMGATLGTQFSSGSQSNYRGGTPQPAQSSNSRNELSNVGQSDN
ncbi:hypothetical protein EB796_006292 [Bugula neritina]|uniref:poly(A)-specific ribonuclease n=1 Tax=Bugula neritina TaxID=10212 RepID=A0A7J7K9S0_BUGNE|nr:hypothetical protein EB796_006292 [Bugula neritina]